MIGFLIGALIACGGYLVFHLLNIERNDRDRLVAAKIAFRAAFSEALVSLNSEPENIPGIINKHGPSHDQAIVNFMPFVPKRDRVQFNEAVSEYRTQLRTARKREPENTQAAQDIKKAIESLLAFAK